MACNFLCSFIVSTMHFLFRIRDPMTVPHGEVEAAAKTVGVDAVALIIATAEAEAVTVMTAMAAKTVNVTVNVW